MLRAWCHEAALPSGAAGGSGLLELGTSGPCRGLLTGRQGLGHGLASFPSPRDISSGSSLIFQAKVFFRKWTLLVSWQSGQSIAVTGSREAPADPAGFVTRLWESFFHLLRGDGWFPHPRGRASCPNGQGSVAAVLQGGWWCPCRMGDPIYEAALALASCPGSLSVFGSRGLFCFYSSAACGATEGSAPIQAEMPAAAAGQLGQGFPTRAPLVHQHRDPDHCAQHRPTGQGPGPAPGSWAGGLLLAPIQPPWDPPGPAVPRESSRLPAGSGSPLGCPAWLWLGQQVGWAGSPVPPLQFLRLAPATRSCPLPAGRGWELRGPAEA